MSVFDKYNEQRKNGTYQAQEKNVTRQDFEANIQRDAPELYNTVQQLRAINMWNSYVQEQQRRYEEAVNEVTHGRGNRSYLREEMLSGSYRNQQAMEAEEKRENAGKSAWESFIGMIGTGAAAQYAPASQKVDFLKQNEEYAKRFQQANSDLKAVNNWAGRDALVREYKELQNRIYTDERRLERGGPGDAAQLQKNKQRLEEIRRELEAKDKAAGNEPQSYSTADRLDSIVGGAVKNIGGSLTSAAVTAADAVSRARENRKIMSDFLKNPETSVDPQQFRDVQSGAYRSEESQQKWDSVYQMAKTLSDDAAAELERAKGGLGFVGRAGVDIGENIIEMGFDAAVGYLTGGSALVPMFARVFGQGAQEARNAGATLDQQIGYGLTSAMIEVATEKMFDGVARIYGAGAADEITERVIGRLAQSDAGRSFLRLIASGVGEGAEEVVSDLLSPLAESIYKDQSAGELYRELNPADLLYDYFIGAAIGTLGGGASYLNGQNAAKNAELRDIDAQRAEQRAMRQAGYGTVSNQVDAAWDVLTGRVTPEQQQSRTAQAQETIGLTPEQARTVEQYQNAPEEVRGKAVANANTAALLTSTFTASGIELNETEQETLTRLAQEGEAGTKDTVLGMRDAYRLGQQGKTLEETTLAVEERGLTPTQISRAWGFGASVQTAESGTADVSTEEGRTKVEAALSPFGRHVDAAAKLYEERQDVGRYAAAMQKAAFLYAANGADLTQIVQDARDGKTADIVGYLTDEQVKLAQEIGQEQRQQVREAEKAVSDNMEAIRQQAAAITAGQTVTAQALAETDTAIDVANRASQRAVNAINRTVERLEAMVKANPNAENTEAYKQAYDEAMQQKKKIEGLQRTVRELTRKKAEMEGKKTIKRKKGTISYAGGTVEGKRYDGVDPAKLTRQQKKVTAMVETLADAVNLDYVFISADPGMGGAYVKGGTVYVNINAGMGVGGFSQTMAAGSLSHELTHWMQDYAPEQYRELKDFIISEILKANPQELRRLVEQQRRWEQGRSLSYEQALDDVVANACQKMLLDSKAINKLARQNMNLTARIADYIEDWTNKIKEAFAEVDTSQGAIYDAVRAVEGSLDQIQELWDNGIENAAKNYNAQQLIGSEKAPIKEVPKPQMQAWKELEDEINNAGLNLKSKAKMQTWSEAEEDYRQEQELETQIQEAEDALDFEDDEKVRRSLENRLVKLRADYDKLVAKERRLSKKTSIDEILNNLSRYRYNDLESIANQFSDGAWDIEPGTPREQLEEELREALEERAADMTPLQRQAPREGFFVRPAETRGQFQRWDETDGDTAAEANGREQSYARLQSENKILKDTVKALNRLTGKQSTTIEKLQERLRLNKTPEVREDDAKKMARSILREYGSKADSEAVARQLKEIGDYILQTSTDKVSEEEIKSRARAVAAEIIDAASEQISVDGEYMAEIVSSIRGKKLTIDDAFLGELDQAGGFEAFRRRNFGKFTLAKRSGSYDASQYMSVSQFYTDLQNNYGKSYFPDAANEGEEIIRIADAFDLARPMEVNPFEQYMGEAVEDLANRIAMDTMGGVLRAEPVKYADVEYRKEKSRNEELNERIKQLEAENALTHEEAGRLWNQVSDLTTKLDLAETQYAALQKSAEARLEQVRAEGRERETEIKAREREKAARDMKALKEYYRRKAKSQKEMRENAARSTKYRADIERKAKKLRDMLLTNSDKLHVPEVLKAPLGDFLAGIDMSSKSLLNYDIATQKDQKFHASFGRLLQALSGQQEYFSGTGEVQADMGGYIDISSDNLEWLRRMTEVVAGWMETGETYTINRMNTQQLHDLSNLLTNLTQAIQNLNNFMANARYETVGEAAKGDITRMEELGRASEAENSALYTAAAWENGTPYYVFKRLGEGARAIFDGLTRGWEKMAFNVQEVIGFTEGLYSTKEVNEWKSKQHEITLEDGHKITMTTAQIMELSMLLEREQALKHIEHGGIRVGDIETRKGRKHDTRHYHLTAGDISKITGLLTERQRFVAKALRNYMASKGSEWGNEISLRRFGYKFYTEGEGYYPIKTDANDRPMADTDAQVNSMFRLLNLSSSKTLNPRASNALIVGDIFETFSDHMADMAKLNGLGLPLLDAIKYFNYKERVDRGDGTYDTVTVQGAMEQAFGSAAQRYYRTLIKDINGVTENGDRGTGLLSKLMSNYKAASVAANLRVAFLQPTSYVRASYLIKPKFLLNAFTSQNAYKEAMEYSGTAVLKSLGYYDTNIARGMRDQIKHNESWKDKAVEKSMKFAEFGDQRTWGRLWVACKLQTAAETGLKGEELKQKTADLFREVIYSSQVMDATLTRSELMRGKTMYSKAMTAFMAEPTLSYNMVMDAGMEYYMNVRRHGKAQAWQESKNYLAKAFTVYACSATFSAIVESVFDALRDDDDMESFFEKWRQAMFGEGNVFGGNLVQDLTIFGKLPYVKSFMSTLQGYKNKDMSNAAFEDALTAFKIWKETIDLATGKLEKPTKTTYYGNMTQWGKIYKSLQALSELSGLGVSNLTRDVLAVWNTAMDLTNHQELKVRTYESSSDRKRREAITALTQQGIPRSLAQQAMQEPDENGDGSLRQDELGTWLTEKIQSGEITKGQADAIWETQGWKTEREKWAESQEKKEAKAQWQDVLDAANAAGDGKGSVTQEELASYLTGEISAGRLTEAEAEEAWKAAGPTWKKSYAEYVRGK